MERQSICLPNKVCGVYAIVCTANHKLYVGSSKDVKGRWTAHRRNLNSNSHENSYLQHSWNKYGEQNFVFSLIEECSPGAQIQREQHYLDLYQSYNRDKGFNIAQIAGLPSMTSETRKRQGKSLKQNAEFMEQARQFMKELHSNPESQRKLVESVKNSELVRQTLQRLNADPEHKQQVQQLLAQVHGDPRIQQIVKGLAQNNIRNEAWAAAHGQKAIVQLTPDSKYIAEYLSLGAIARAGVFSESSVKRICSRKLTEVHRGYRWMYKEDYLESLQHPNSSNP